MKYSTNSTSKTGSTVLVSSTLSTYTPKPIILQRSPGKPLVSGTRPPTVAIQTNSNILSTNNTPLTSLGSLNSSKTPENTSLSQPMIKVVSSNPNNLPVSVTGIGGGVGGSITQKIKFKTPLPKPKVKAKFKPLMPLQRPILSSQNYSDSIILGSSTATVTVTSTSPNKSMLPSQGMSVKVVQVTKSSSMSSAATLMSSLNKPVVVVSNGNALKNSQKLSFSTVPTSVTQQLKVVSSSGGSTSITQSLPKGTLTSKSMPLATGFKMIAVTTVVPGTTQVKTVYIATPIMSLPKTVSQSSHASITTAAPQNVRHISSSLASNLQSVVARSINTSSNKTPNIQSSFSVAQSTLAAVSVAKTNKMTPQPKGLGSFKTTLAGTAQSLKLFTAVSKSRSALTTNSISKSTPLLPSTSLLTSVVSQSQTAQRFGNTVPKALLESNLRLRNEKADSNNANGTFLNISTVGLNSAPLTNGLTPSNENPVPATITVNASSLEEVNATLNLLNDENSLTAEQLTTSGEADDMAFLNAGEKFLEQLSAKMTATSPESLSKTESFLFPSNLTLDMGDSAQHVFEVNDYDLAGANNATSTISIDKNIVLQNGTVKQQQPALIAKDTSFFLTQKGVPATPKLLNSILPPGAKVLQPSSNSLSIGAFSQNPIGQTPVMMTPVFQNKNDVNNSPAILNYTNITNVSGKSEKDLSKVGFITMGSSQAASGIVIDGLGAASKPRPNNSMKISSPSTANKIPMSIPGSSKLNISPLLVNNMSNSLPVESDKTLESLQQDSPKASNNPATSNNLQFFMTQNNHIGHVVDESNLNNNDLASILNQSIETNANNKSVVVISEQKKRKYGDLSSPRSQASWVRSAKM